MMKIVVMGYREALNYVYKYSGIDRYPKYAIISIQEPTFGYGIGLKLKKGGNCLAALNIEFGDVTPAMDKDLQDIELQKQLMTTNQAKDIHDFVESLPKEVELLIVHCNAGVSRSAGVAAAILMAKTGSDKEIFEAGTYCPNMYVYYNVLEAYGLTNRYYSDEYMKEYDKIWNSSDNRVSINLEDL